MGLDKRFIPVLRTCKSSPNIGFNTHTNRRKCTHTREISFKPETAFHSRGDNYGWLHRLLIIQQVTVALGQFLSLPSPVKFMWDQKYYYSLNQKNYTLPTTFNI